MSIPTVIQHWKLSHYTDSLSFFQPLMMTNDSVKSTKTLVDMQHVLTGGHISMSRHPGSVFADCQFISQLSRHKKRLSLLNSRFMWTVIIVPLQYLAQFFLFFFVQGHNEVSLNECRQSSPFLKDHSIKIQKDSKFSIV